MDWRGLGSIVGIGVGSLDLMLVKASFQSGEIIHGRVLLKLEERTEAKRLVVGVHATEERESTDAHGTRHRETRTRYRVERELDGKRAYRGDEGYDFHLPLPGGGELPMPDGVLGDVAKFVQFVAAVTRPTLDWRVYAFLDIPWKANVKASKGVIVR